MNLSELRSWLSLQTLIPYTADEIEGYLNQAYRDLATEHPWPWTYASEAIVLVDGTAEYDLPADLNVLDEVVYDDQGAEAQPRRTSLQSVRARFGGSVGESSLPPEYYRQGNQIVFVPTPSASQNVTLHFYQSPADLDAEEDEPAFHSAFHVVLAEFAASLYYESEESFQMSEFYRSKGNNTLRRMLEFYNVQLPPERVIIGGGVPPRLIKPYTTWPEL